MRKKMATKINKIDNQNSNDINSQLVEELLSKAEPSELFGRDGKFTPQLVPKGGRRFNGFDDKVISLYARGMTMSEIQGHLEEIYQTEISKDLISTIADSAF
jgi:putative transposase